MLHSKRTVKGFVACYRAIFIIHYEQTGRPKNSVCTFGTSNFEKVVGSILDFDSYVLFLVKWPPIQVFIAQKGLLGYATQEYGYNWPSLCSFCAVEMASPHRGKTQDITPQKLQTPFTSVYWNMDGYRQEIGRWTHPNTPCYERPFQTRGMLHSSFICLEETVKTTYPDFEDVF